MYLMIKRTVMLIFVTISYIYIFIYMFNADKINYCYNDVYCYAQYYSVAIVLFISGLYIVYYMKYEYRDSIILLENHMKKVWGRISRKIAVESIIITIYSFIICTVYAFFSGYSYKCNWTDDYSNAWRFFLRHVDTYIDTWIIQSIYLIVVFSEIFVMGMMIMLFWWWFNLPVYGYVGMIAMVVVEMFGYVDDGLFFSKISMNPSDLYLNGYSLVNNVVIPIAAISIIWIVGLFTLRKKDMLRKESDI